MIEIFITERKKSLYKSLLLSEAPEDEEEPAEDEGGEEGNFVDEESMDDEGFGGEEGSDDTSGDTSSMGGGDTGEVDPTLKLTKTKKRKLILLKQYEELDKYFKNNEIGYIELTPKDIELLSQSVTPEIFYNKDKTYKTFLSNRSIYNFPKSDIKNGIKMEYTTFKEMIIINRFIIKNKKYTLKNTYKSLNFNYSKQII